MYANKCILCTSSNAKWLYIFVHLQRQKGSWKWSYEVKMSNNLIDIEEKTERFQIILFILSETKQNKNETILHLKALKNEVHLFIYSKIGREWRKHCNFLSCL